MGRRRGVAVVKGAEGRGREVRKEQGSVPSDQMSDKEIKIK